MPDDRYAVILAGGRGERFWPLSTTQRPKQLLSLVGDKTLLAQAVDRLEGLVPPQRVFVITSVDLIEATQKAAPALPPENIIGEPMGRDTAPAVALAAALVKARHPNATFCILTADHVIGDLALYRTTLREAMDLSLKQDVLITIGIQPNLPSTGYGYIEAGESVAVRSRIEFLKAKRFVEKPNLETATGYVESGRFFWNSGMFIWSVNCLEDSLLESYPPLGGLIDRLVQAIRTGRLSSALESEYPQLQKISIDYALMEKSDNILMARGEFAWDDVGAWPALENHFTPDRDGNVVVGGCECLDSHNNIVVSGNRLTALIGMEDVVVVQADGVTLVCPKDRAQDIKSLVAELRENPNYSEIV